MKRFIRYLYEYEQRRRARNVGFVKVEETQDSCTIHIHAKGLYTNIEREMQLFLLVETKQGIEKIPEGEIYSQDMTMNVKFSYDREDLPEGDLFDRVSGVLLEEGTERKYMAVWEGVQAEPAQILTYNPECMDEEEDLQEEFLEELQEPFSCGIRSEGVFEQIESENEINGIEETKEEPVFQIEKIQRNDLVKLARCEWKLANNPFLMHGYYNYHYLVLIEQDENRYLGVPGIYHEQEEKAADSYGFGYFIPKDQLNDQGEDSNQEEMDSFGYWCRPVKRGACKGYEK